MTMRLPGNERKARKRARDRAYYLANRDRLIDYAREYGHKWHKAHPQNVKAMNKRHRQKIRRECIDAYGGICECCGLAESGFLSIDHVNNDGAQHRRDNKLSTAGFQVYRWLKANGYPRDGFRLLCYNCNLGRHFNGGLCPHESSPDSASRLAT